MIKIRIKQQNIQKKKKTKEKERKKTNRKEEYVQDKEGNADNNKAKQQKKVNINKEE